MSEANIEVNMKVEATETLYKLEIARLNLEALQNSVIFEAIKKHWFFAMDSLEIFLETEANRDPDTVSEFLDAARFAATQGRRYPVESLTEWLENETNK